MTADDLLRRALRYLQKTDSVSTLAEDIEKYLEEPKDNFCDGNCTWLDHHPDCVYVQKDEPVACKRCNGTGVVDDGEIDCYSDGTPYLNGPVKCVKDCPDCHPPTKTAPKDEPDTDSIDMQSRCRGDKE